MRCCCMTSSGPLKYPTMLLMTWGQDRQRVRWGATNGFCGGKVAPSCNAQGTISKVQKQSVIQPMMTKKASSWQSPADFLRDTCWALIDDFLPKNPKNIPFRDITQQMCVIDRKVGFDTSKTSIDPRHTIWENQLAWWPGNDMPWQAMIHSPYMLHSRASFSRCRISAISPCIYHHLSMWPIFAQPIFAKSVLHLSECSEFSWWLFGVFWQTLHPNRTHTYSTQQLGPPPREKLARELRKHRMRWNTDLNSLEKHREDELPLRNCPGNPLCKGIVKGEWWLPRC